jgi:hypothetical protein
MNHGSEGSATLSLGSKVVRLIFNIHVHLRFLSAVYPRASAAK